MRLTFFLLLLTLIFKGVSAQTITETVSASAVTAHMDANGPFFFKNLQNAGFYVTDFNGIDVEIPTIYASGLWLGARRSGENFTRVSKSTYTSEDFLFGPANYVGTFDFNRVWKVTGQEINAHIQDFTDGVINETPAQSILDWPGFGNPLLGSEFPEQMFASFFDENQDGVYDPYTGDYPIISGDLLYVRPLEMAFTIFHDNPLGTDPIGIEVHATMYSLDCEDETILDRSIFTSHKIINQNVHIDELFIGYWTDFDLGCYLDDFTGCDPDRGALYAYNKDDYDGDANTGCAPGVPTSFENNPVVHGSKFLNQEMYSHLVSHYQGVGSVPPATTDPTQEAEVVNFLNGLWRDGTPITYGGIGYDLGSTEYVNHMVPSDPTDTDGWSMITADFPISDIRSLATMHTGSLLSGTSVTFDMVQLVTMDADYDNLEKVALNLEEMDILQEAYDNEFADLCSSLLNALNNFEVGDISIYPNPVHDQLTMVQSENIEVYKIYDIMGRVVMAGNIDTERITIDLDLHDGVYWIQASTSSTVFAAQKFVVAAR